MHVYWKKYSTPWTLLETEQSKIRFITNENYRKSYDTIRYDTIGEFNVDWKAEYSALSSTRSTSQLNFKNGGQLC